MTYCVAWKHQGHAYLLADTLRTTSHPPEANRTSLNQPHKQIGLEFVSETLLKIVAIRDGVACAIAGDVMRAFGYVDFISEHFDSFSSPREALSALSTSFGPFNPQARVGLLIVWSGKGRKCSIASWDSATDIVQDDADMYQIGSLDHEHKQLTSFFLEQIRAKTPEPTSVLIAEVATVQSYGQHDDVISQHVGGIVCGLRVHDGSTYWQDDTTTIVYADGQIAGCVSLHFREGVMILHSTHHGREGLIFTTRNSRGSNVEELRNWSVRWGSLLWGQIAEHCTQCKNWIFLHRDWRIATGVCALGRIEDARDQFSVRAQGEELHIQFTDKFQAVLYRGTSQVRATTSGVDLAVFVVAG